jgi:hypothetical protein
MNLQGQPSHPTYPIWREKVEDALHAARKKEQRVWGSGADHEKARAEVERLEAILESFLID